MDVGAVAPVLYTGVTQGQDEAVVDKESFLLQFFRKQEVMIKQKYYSQTLVFTCIMFASFLFL